MESRVVMKTDLKDILEKCRNPIPKEHLEPKLLSWCVCRGLLTLQMISQEYCYVATDFGLSLLDDPGLLEEELSN